MSCTRTAWGPIIERRDVASALPIDRGWVVSVHLIGGGRDALALTPLFDTFVAEARAITPTPRILLLLVLEPDDDESVERFAALLREDGAEVLVRAIEEGQQFSPSDLDSADGICVGGGLTPAYADAVQPVAESIRERVADGAPYLGFSAGAAIAAESALVGGYLVDGIIVCDEDAGEELDEVTFAPGLGLVPFAVDVHAAAWGTVSRLLAAVGAGLAPEGVAIDEHTAVIVEAVDADPRVTGLGAAWHAWSGADGAVQLRRRLAAR